MFMDFFLSRPSRHPPRRLREPSLARLALPPISIPAPRPEGCPMSPREMADWAYEHYLGGALSWEDYQLALPSDLHRDYNATIGALTGETAKLDRRRDMLADWQTRIAFARAHHHWDAATLRRAERILTLLRRRAGLYLPDES